MLDIPEYPRRFIAGATCTKCQHMDTTVIFTTLGKYYTECTQCRFTQCQDDLSNIPKADEKKPNFIRVGDVGTEKRQTEIPLRQLKQRKEH
ncbi:MAG: YheV family putative metal-binding protein [Gammaproteobacteria bacterium]